MYVISACLVGVNCKYNGGNNDNDKVHAFIEGKDHMLVCPEEIAGISTPRPPAEIIEDRVYNKLGKDVTADFERGAIETYRLATEKATELGQPIEGAIFKAKSPSCGSGRIYDGSFSGTVIPGDGKTAAYFKKQGVKVITEEDL